MVAHSRTLRRCTSSPAPYAKQSQEANIPIRISRLFWQFGEFCSQEPSLLPTCYKAEPQRTCSDISQWKNMYWILSGHITNLKGPPAAFLNFLLRCSPGLQFHLMAERSTLFQLLESFCIFHQSESDCLPAAVSCWLTSQLQVENWRFQVRVQLLLESWQAPALVDSL